MMSRQGLTLLGLGGGHNPATTHIRPVLCMRTQLDRTQRPITVHRCYQHTIQTHCCRSSRHSSTSNNNSKRQPNPLIHHSNLRKQTVHIQTVQWRRHNHSRSLRHRRLATHLYHRRQVRFLAYFYFLHNRKRRCGFCSMLYHVVSFSDSPPRSPSHTRNSCSQAHRL